MEELSKPNNPLLRSLVNVGMKENLLALYSIVEYEDFGFIADSLLQVGKNKR